MKLATTKRVTAAEEVRIRVDDVDYRVPAGRTILQALDDVRRADEAGGVDIPHYCWHPKLSIDGSCRLCQVEVLDRTASPSRSCRSPATRRSPTAW